MTQIIKINTSDLEKIVIESGIEVKEGEDIKKSYAPFLNDLFTLQDQMQKIDFTTPTEIDEKIAREIRLKIVKVRTGASDLKDQRKRIYLLKGNLEQAAFNLIKTSCELVENLLYNVEKAREIAEAKRKAERKENRLGLLSAYEYDCQYVDLLNMPDEQFDKLIIQLEAEKQAKKEAEIKAEQERIENERKAKLYQERKEQLIPYWNFLKEDQNSIDFSELPEQSFNIILAEAKQSKKEYEKEQERIRIENEKLRKEREEAERKQREIEEKAKIERERIQRENEQRLETERKQKEQAEAELRKIQEQKRIEEQKAQDELRQKQEAEMKAKAAPDKQKLDLFIQSFPMCNLELTTEQGIVIQNLLNEKISAFKNWAKSQLTAM